jgi:putative chitinase
MRLDKKFFFDTVRDSKLFGGSLSETQVATMDAIIDSYSGESFDHLSYILATPYHEVGKDLEPVSENLNYSAKRLREVWPARFKSDATAKKFANNPEALGDKVYGGRLGNAANEGYLYRGRGLSQITGKENYAKFGKLMSIDLVGNPDLALKPAVAARILVVGMERGLFTGKKLADYDAPGGFMAVGARAIINADAKRATKHGDSTVGEDIAEYAAEFSKAMRAATAETAAPVPVPPTDSTPVPAPGKPNQKNGIIALLVAIGGIVAAVLKGLGVIG